MTTNCNCTGALCTCTGESILKDGHAIRISPLFRDSASGAQMMTDSVSVSDAAYQAMKDHDREAWRGTGGKRFDARDAVAAVGQETHDHAYAVAREAGLTEDQARHHAAREKMLHQDANAWKGAA